MNAGCGATHAKPAEVMSTRLQAHADISIAASVFEVVIVYKHFDVFNSALQLRIRLLRCSSPPRIMPQTVF